MTGHEIGYALLAAALLTLALAAGIATRALILAWTRTPRHARQAAIDAEARAHVSALRGEATIRDDIYAQPYRLPWTPRAERLATDTDVRTFAHPPAEPGPPIVASVTDARPSRVPDGFLVYTGGDLSPALAERLASDTDVRNATPTFAERLLSCDLAAIDDMFATGQFAAVTGA